MTLSDMQKRYVWLAGSYPKHVVVQGQGKRTPRTLYALDDDHLYIFGYANPLYSLLKRGLFCRLQDGHSCALTCEGEAEFRRMLTRGDGLNINAKIREAQLAPRSDSN